MNIQELATIAAANFESGHRDPQPDSGSDFRRFKRDDKGAHVLPWAEELSLAAHDDGDIWPDDHRYQMIEGALNAIAEFDGDDIDDGDTAHDFADSAVSVYTNARFLWLASHSNRAEYCEEARREGFITEDSTMENRIGAGWYGEALEVFSQVLRFLETQAD